MMALVRHFGDQEDEGQPCGTCDVCDAGACLVRTARAPKPEEREAARGAIEALRRRDGQATGRLHAECGSAGLDRRAFEEVLGGLVRSGLLRVIADTFTKDGRAIPFKRAWLTPQGRKAPLAGIEFALAGEADALAGSGSRRKKGKPSKERPPGSASVADTNLVAALKTWRLTEARRAGVPAFRVLHDRTLLAIAAARPQHEAALLAVPGFGPGLLKRYGVPVLALCRGTGRPVVPRGSRVAP
jgi:DNA topoisomerase III